MSSVTADTVPAEETKRKSGLVSMFEHTRYVLGENRVTAFAFGLLVVILFAAIFGPYVVPYDPLASDTARNVIVTNPGKRGFVVRTGDWPGATWSNSQSNHTVLEQCRVYATASTTQAFSVINCNGVRITDCISEGGPCDHDLFLSATTDGNEDLPAKNTVVKQFALSNFHVEHAVRKASIHVNMPSKCSVDLSQVYWNGPQKAPVIYYVGGQLNLMGIGWFTEDMRIGTRVSAPRITIKTG